MSESASDKDVARPPAEPAESTGERSLEVPPDPQYDELLRVVRMFKDAGVKGLSKPTKETAGFHEMFSEWYFKNECGRLYVETMQKAVAMVRMSRLFMDGGYSGGSGKKAAAEKILEALGAALRDHVNPAIIDYLDAELEKLSSTEGFAELMENELRRYEGVLTPDAQASLAGILHYPEFKRKSMYTVKKKIHGMIDRIREVRGQPPMKWLV